MEKQYLENSLNHLRRENCFQATWLMLLCVWLQYDLEVAQDSDLTNRALHESNIRVQPITGIVLWMTNEEVKTAPIQLVYSYFAYGKVVNEQVQHKWNAIDSLLDQVGKRWH